MATKSLTILSTFSLLVLAFAVHLKIEEVDGTRLALTYLGVVDGKQYFIDTATTYTWPSARDYCNSSNMALATVETVNEAMFIRQQFTGTYSNVWTWIAMREPEFPKNMVWNGNSSSPREDIFDESVVAAEPVTCGQMIFNQTGDSLLKISGVSCTSSKRVLCQLVL